MNSSKSEQLSIVFLLFVVLFLGVVVYYDQASTPAEKVVGISLSQFQIIGVQTVNSSGSTLIIQFNINNRDPLGATVLNASYDLYGDGNYIGRGEINDPVLVPARGSVIATTDFLLPLKGSLQGSFSYFLDGGNVDWRAIGNATLLEKVVGKFIVQFNCISTSQQNPISCSYVLQ